MFICADSSANIFYICVFAFNSYTVKTAPLYKSTKFLFFIIYLVFMFYSELGLISLTLSQAQLTVINTCVPVLILEYTCWKFKILFFWSVFYTVVISAPIGGALTLFFFNAPRQDNAICIRQGVEEKTHVRCTFFSLLITSLRANRHETFTIAELKRYFPSELL